VNSKVAMAVTMEEEALSKALSMSQISNVSPQSNREPRTDKIVSIQASGCYSAAVTAQGDLYTWGYGSGAAIGHPVPSEDESDLPLIPIIEGNQYSTTTAAKVFPEGGDEDNIIRDCRCFDTDLNVMLPRRVECIQSLGLRAEDVQLGPGHMVLICSLRDGSNDNGISHETPDGARSPFDHAEDSQDSAMDDYGNNSLSNVSNANQSGASSASSAQGLNNALGNDGSHRESSAGSGLVLDDYGTLKTVESNDSSKSEKRRRSPGWMTKIKSSRISKNNNSISTSQQQLTHGAEGGVGGAAGGGGPEPEKRKSFNMHMGKMLDVALRRGGEK